MTLRRIQVGWLLFVVAACTSASPSTIPAATTAAPTDAPSATTPAPSAKASTASAATPPPEDITPQFVPDHGTFTGQVTSGSQTYPIVLWMDGCPHTQEVCGDIEYADPKHPEFTLCAPQLVFKGREGDRDVFEENPAYRADRCPPTTLKIGSAGGSGPLTLAVDAYTDVDAPPSGQGTVTQTSDQPPGDEPAPTLPAIDGLTGPLVSVDLGGPTTQYSAADSMRAYFPMQGGLSTVVPATGESDFMAGNDNVASTADPKAVTIIGDAIWITRGPSKTLERVDVTPEAAETPPIQLEHAPYALAADGSTLWVTSLDDSVVMAVDTKSGQVLATVDVPSPAGVAVGGGSIWVVEHAAGKLARIDPHTYKVTDEVSLGTAGDDPTCGMCAEDVVYAFDSAWTANNFGRSITRVDGHSLKATTIPTKHRVWSVAAHGHDLYGSQFEEIDGYIDRSVGGIVRIDPRTDKAKQLSAPGVLGVAALGDDLWLIVPARRSDFVLRYK